MSLNTLQFYRLAMRAQHNATQHIMFIESVIVYIHSYLCTLQIQRNEEPTKMIHQSIDIPIDLQV